MVEPEVEAEVSEGCKPSFDDDDDSEVSDPLRRPGRIDARVEALC